MESLLSKLDQGKIFAKLDLTNAYLQLSVDEETAKMQTIITTKGAFKCNRLQFGISAAPGIFQSLIEEKLMEFPDILPFFDDIIVVAQNEDKLAKRL